MRYLSENLCSRRGFRRSVIPVIGRPIMGDMERRPPKRPSRWQRLLARLRIRPLPQEPEPPEDPHDYAMVPSGTPRPPRPAGAEALPLPEDEPPPADAVGREE
jgi:hypothetical protein